MGDRLAEAVTYLPASFVRAVAAGGPRELPWCDEVEGTLVMADLSGFTALSERLAGLGDEGAERLTGIINAFFARMLETAWGYGGDALTFGGDAILLLFDGDDHATRAAAGALAMLKQVERTAAVDAGDGKVKIGMSVGAHSGAFLLAAAGLAESAHLFVLGRGAEATAQAEAQAERGQLAVSPATKDLLPRGAVFARAGAHWRVAASTSGGSGALDSHAAGLAGLSEERLQRLTSFLPPHARARDDEGARRVLHAPEHRRTVIAFVNVLGLDELIERAGRDVALQQFQAYAAMLGGLTARHHGYVVGTDIATAGSKLVVTFGTPVAHEYAPANAARFAVDLCDGLRESGLDLRHRIGLNGGHVFAGEVGPPSRRQYTVMGDAVNLAARLMGAAQPGEALISSSLLEHVSPDLCARELEPITVKGKEKPVGVCVLERQRGVGGQVRRRAGEACRQGDLVGRRAELGLLRRTWGRVLSGGGRTVFIEGDAGVGKTRLLEEALRDISRPGTTRRVAVTRAACFEHLQAAPFTPWVDALQAVLGLSGEGAAARRTETVRAHVGLHLRDLAEFGSLLNPLLNLSLSHSRVVGSLDAQTRRDKLFELVARILDEAAGHAGHVVVLEDLHWADESSLALVGYLARRETTAPVLLLLTSRPVGMPAGLEDAGASRVVLAELSEAESLVMVREALEVEDLPADVGEALYAKTKGNPLFLEEVIRSLQAPGVLDRVLGGSSVTRAAELAALQIPDRVQGLLMSRIDRLQPDTREVLKAGSVVGRSFDATVLRGTDDDVLRSVALERAFEELTAAALAVPGDGADDGTLTFRHALVQDVAYESLPFARRRRLHGEVARYLESAQPVPDHALLVHHFGRAGDAERTRLHAVRASEASVAVYASLEAVDYLTIARGTTTARTSHDACLRSRFEELEGDSLVTLARHDDAIARFTRARRRWASPAVRAAADEALGELAPVHDADARDGLLCWKIAVSLERGRSACRQALRWLARGAAALPPGRDALAARILVSKCAFLARLGRFREAVEFGEEGLELARREGDAALQAYALTMLANACAGLGLLERAMDCDAESVALYEQAGDLAGQALSHLNVASSFFLLGDLSRALEHEELSLSLYARIGNVSGVASQHHNVAGVLLQMGEVDAALEHLEESLRLRDHPGVGPQVAGFALVLLCKARVWAGDLDGADEALAECLDILRSIDAQTDLLDAGVIEAELRLVQGDLARAEDACTRVLAEARASEAELNEAQALCMLGRVRLARGEPDAALEGLETAAAVAERIGADYERGQALAALAEARVACSPDRECLTTLDEAIALFERMGAGYDLARALESRARLAPAAG